MSILLTVCIVLCIMPTVIFAEGSSEQFNLEVGETYYFDLSGEHIPYEDGSPVWSSWLCYVPFTYAGNFKSRKAYDWSVEVAIYVKSNARGKGIGKLLYTVLEKSLQGIGVLNMNACIAITQNDDAHLDNASRRFHEKMGFHLVGTFHNSGYKFNTWYDMIWMEKMIGEHKEQQENVRYGEWTI